MLSYTKPSRKRLGSCSSSNSSSSVEIIGDVETIKDADVKSTASEQTRNLQEILQADNSPHPIQIYNDVSDDEKPKIQGEQQVEQEEEIEQGEEIQQEEEEKEERKEENYKKKETNNVSFLPISSHDDEGSENFHIKIQSIIIENKNFVRGKIIKNRKVLNKIKECRDKINHLITLLKKIDKDLEMGEKISNMLTII